MDEHTNKRQILGAWLIGMSFLLSLAAIGLLLLASTV